eukprot:scaffold327407_cov693-Tisochrysis_lutea.AAC.1
MWLTDIAHHHLAIAVVFIFAGHMYRTNWGIGHSMKEILDAHVPPKGRLGSGHRGLFETITDSLHMQLGLALASLGVATSLVAQHMYALPSYAFMAKDYVTQAALYTHHQYIAGFLMVGAFAHGAIFFVRDYDPEVNKDNVLARMLQHKEAIISHLSWVSLFLGFHTLVFAQFIQAASGSKIWLPGWVEAINSGALDARGSKLMPDKKDFGYSFPCDGPGRGGTCDISAWDAFYLAMFWMLNTIGWVTFYWHWKHMTIWGGNAAAFNESSTYIMGWLRDYLWLNSSPLINGYNAFGMNAQAVWAWMFLFGHLIWATGFMFLISWRGYWQELIETLVWAHERTPIANLVKWRDKPVALSIVQARLVGLAHFTIGYIFTYAPFVIASTTGKFS